MKISILLVLTFAVLGTQAARSYSPGEKKTICHRGNCVDYCNIDYINLEPGETYEEDCVLTSCGEDFSVTQESCGILKTNNNCTLTPDYSLKYPGNSLTIEQYNNLTLCHSELCLQDAERLIACASYISNLNPCENFQNFTCGTFFEERALNERYETIGFQRDLELRNDEKRHKVLKDAIRAGDGKAVRVVKNFYQKCIDWRYVERVSRGDVLIYLNSFGSFPLLTRNWNESQLNFTKLFNEVKLEYLVNMRINFCTDPLTTDDVVCMYSVKQHSWERYKTTSAEFTTKDIRDMFSIFGISTEGVDDMVDGFFNTSSKRDGGSSDRKSLIVKINELQKTFEFPEIDWLRLINAQLPGWLHRDVNDSILIRFKSLLKSRLNFLATVDRRQLANIIFIEILYEYRNLFQIYPFNYKQFKAAVKTPQRFEICSGLIESLMTLPAKILFDRRYFPMRFKTAAEGLMKSATLFLNEKFIETRKQLKFVAGVPSTAIDDSFLDKIYRNLTLNGNESLFETFAELSKFQRFLKLVDLSNDEHDIVKILQQTARSIFACSVVKGKFLYCPATALQYPIFHPDRSNFFNYAMLVPEIVEAIGSSLSEYLNLYENDIAFDFYSKEFPTTESEANLPGFLLDNKQMYWMALQHKRCRKGKDLVTVGYSDTLEMIGLHRITVIPQMEIYEQASGSLDMKSLRSFSLA